MPGFIVILFMVEMKSESSNKVSHLKERIVDNLWLDFIVFFGFFCFGIKEKMSREIVVIVQIIP